MQRGLQGHFNVNTGSGEAVRAFIPAPLPPSPPIAELPELREKFDNAMIALGRLDTFACRQVQV